METEIDKPTAKKSLRKSLADSSGEEEVQPSAEGADEKGDEIDAAKVKSFAARARKLGNEDWPFYVVGGVGAIMSGLFFPAFGFVFADMIGMSRLNKMCRFGCKIA